MINVDKAIDANLLSDDVLEQLSQVPALMTVWGKLDADTLVVALEGAWGVSSWVSGSIVVFDKVVDGDEYRILFWRTIGLNFLKNHANLLSIDNTDMDTLDKLHAQFEAHSMPFDYIGARNALLRYRLSYGQK